MVWGGRRREGGAKLVLLTRVEAELADNLRQNPPKVKPFVVAVF